MFEIIEAANAKRIMRAMLRADSQGTKAIMSGIRDGFDLMGNELVRKAQDAIRNGPKTGRIYKINGALHQASAPGEAPANLSGTLLGSVNSVARDMELEFGYEVFYGSYLEEGTSKMAARPNIQKRAQEIEKSSSRFFNDTINRALRRWIG